MMLLQEKEAGSMILFYFSEFGYISPQKLELFSVRQKR
jgi:hypothetical protein